MLCDATYAPRWVLSSLAASTIAETRYSCRCARSRSDGGRVRQPVEVRVPAARVAGRHGPEPPRQRGPGRRESAAGVRAEAQGQRGATGPVAAGVPGRPGAKRTSAVCTRLPAVAEVWRPSRRPSASRSVQPSLTPRNPLDVAPRAGRAASALADPPSLATSARPAERPVSSIRVLDSVGSSTAYTVYRRGSAVANARSTSTVARAGSVTYVAVSRQPRAASRNVCR